MIKLKKKLIKKWTKKKPESTNQTYDSGHEIDNLIECKPKKILSLILNQLNIEWWNKKKQLKKEQKIMSQPT